MASAIVVGGAGRMGRLVREELLARGFEVLGSYDVDNIDELDAAAPAADVAADFSAPAALPHTLAYARRTGAAVVCGTTGLADDQLDELRALGEKNRVIWASNYSLGVAALRRATALVAATLAAVRSVSGDSLLILGGSDKGENFDDLFANLPDSVKYVLVSGANADKITESAAKCKKFNVFKRDTLENCVTESLSFSVKNVIFSPSSASFDRFIDYKDRGRAFNRYFNGL